MSPLITRRNALAKIAGGVAMSATISPLLAVEVERAGSPQKAAPRAPGKPSVEALCQTAAALGLTSVELQGPDEWATLKKFGLDCALTNGADLGPKRGFNQTEYHEKLIANYRQIIPQLAKAGFMNLICYSGARGGLEAQAALANSAEGVKKLLKLAEKHQVTLYMELTNNGVNAKDYDPEYSVQYSQLARHIGSERFKILQEVYQLQTMPPDAISAIRKYQPYLGHYYPAGLPKKEFAKAATGAENMLQFNRALKLAA